MLTLAATLRFVPVVFVVVSMTWLAASSPISTFFHSFSNGPARCNEQQSAWGQETGERWTHLVHHIDLGQRQILKRLRVELLAERARFELRVMECQRYT